jgi:hypothetical protein
MAHGPTTRVLLPIAVLLLGAGCTAVGGFAPDQASPGKFGGPEPGELTALPTPGAAAPFGPPTKRGGAVTQSFKVTGLAPADLLPFYADALREQRWVVSTAPSWTGDVWRGQWVRGDRLLQVTAEPDVDDGTSGDKGAPTSQLDLELSTG